jgi:hypothetical protein
MAVAACADVVAARVASTRRFLIVQEFE